MKDFLKFIISSVVDNPEEVVIDEKAVENNYFEYLIHVNPDDVGKIIGKEGKIIQSVRNLAKILAVKENKRARIEIA